MTTQSGLNPLERTGQTEAMVKEIERKFLVADDSWRDEADGGRLYLQAYVAVSNGNSARVRIVGDGTATLTVKMGGGRVREEFEYPIPISDARRMLESGIGTLIEKTFEGGRDLLAGLDVPIYSLITIASMKDGKFDFSENH